MLTKHLTVCVAATALMTAAAVAQTSPAAPGANQSGMSNQPATTMQPATGSQQPGVMPNQSSTSSGGSTMSSGSTMSTDSKMSSSSTMSGSAASGQLLTQMSPQQMRGSELMGVDVYGSDNEKIGDIDELIVGQDGRLEAIVVGVGGFLGIGEKNVAIPFDQVEFLSERQVEAMNASNRTAAGTTAGGVTTPATPGAGQPATTGSTNQPGMAAASADDDDNEPERAMVKMTRAQLKDAAEFRYGDEPARTGTTGGAANTSPPASTTRPGNAPAPQ
jgi:sporulation protein YlmC with PRC-barrel domain